MDWLQYSLVIIFGFLLEVVDASLGMGYGTILTPALLMMGFEPLQVVPAVLVSQLAGDFAAAFFHHEFKNVNLSLGTPDFKVAGVLSLFGIFGSIVGVSVAIRLPKFWLNIYIGSLVAATGLFVLITQRRRLSFSWARLVGLSSLAAFNKGVSGGGYGPLVTSGQLLTGVEVKGTIGITSLAEGFTCIVATAMYIVLGKHIDWLLATLLSIGVLLSAPVSAYIVSRVESGHLRLAIGLATLALGLLTVTKAL